MTSGTFETVLIDSIIINREKRQRKTLEKVEELAESIRKLGLINPPVIDRDMVLIAGETRLEACRLIGLTSIPVQYADTIDPIVLHLIELEENIKRVDLSWQDRVDAISKYHSMQVEADPSWTYEKTADAINMSYAAVSQFLSVKDALNAGVKGIADAPTMSVAKNIAKRAREREKSSAKLELQELTDPGAAQAKPRRAELLNLSFFDFQSELKFNFLHCDFPYGVNAGDKIGQSGAKILGSYKDTPDYYFDLIEHLCSAPYIADSAHLMFWFSMDFYTPTVEKLEAAGWRVYAKPLIWLKSDNVGIISDPNRTPRHIYETALMASRGDRFVVRSVADSIASPTTKEFHTSEKPKAVLDHFFRMFVDEHTIMLDPTAGSGNAVTQAEAAGAQYALGLEMDTEFYKRAQENLSRA